LKKIAFLTTDLSDFGGTQTVVSRLSNAFVEKLGHKVYIYTLSQKNGKIKCDLNSNIVVINLDINFHFRNYLKLIRKVNSINKINKIDVILGIGCFLNVFLPFFRRVKKVACEHNSYDIVSSKTKFVRGLTYRFVDFIVSSTKEDLPRYLKINKNSITIHNPVLLSDSTYSFKRQNVVISVGTLTERKGMDRLLHVWKLVEEKEKNANLEIFGEGEEFEKLLELKLRLGIINVSFLGNTHSLDAELSHSKIYVLPSRKEGFPMVLLEAMNHYLPVVSFDIKTGPNEIITDGEDGYLIKDDDIGDMADKILRLLTENVLLEKMSKNAKKNVERFSISNIIKLWERILQ